MYTFLTGSTGLLGRYVVRDLLLAGFPVCVLVRGSRRESAADRVETIMQRWERLLGRRLPRPVVASGHLNDPQLGLSNDDAQWVKNNCRRVVHCAASLKFVPEENGEPSRTNIDGTKNLLNFCQWAGIKELHHVSSAYVAGLLNDSVLPTDLNVAESWTNNAYLGSKSVAEEMVRDNKFAESLTIYRPSMIVGDSETGYTNTYHGFYTPLQFGHVMAPKFPAVGTIDRLNFLDLLGLSGQEHKNLVPVDWVSAAMVEIIRTPRLHGASYHLTHPRRSRRGRCKTFFSRCSSRCSAAISAAPNRRVGPKRVPRFKSRCGSIRPIGATIPFLPHRNRPRSFARRDSGNGYAARSAVGPVGRGKQFRLARRAARSLRSPFAKLLRTARAPASRDRQSGRRSVARGGASDRSRRRRLALCRRARPICATAGAALRPTPI